MADRTASGPSHGEEEGGRRSYACALALDLAAKEARAGGFAKVMPGHLVMGLCRLCDLAPEELEKDPGAGEEVARLKAGLGEAALAPEPLLRRVREDMGRPEAPAPPGGLPPLSGAARDILLEAEQSRLLGDRPSLSAGRLLCVILQSSSRKWAALLAELGAKIEPLRAALAPRSPTAKEVIVREGIASARQVLEACGLAAQVGRRWESVLVDQGALSREGYLRALSRAWAVEAVDVRGVTMEVSARGLLPAKTQEQLLALPLGRNGGKLLVAMADPTDRAAVRQISSESGLKAAVCLAYPPDLLSAIRGAPPTDSPAPERRPSGGGVLELGRDLTALAREGKLPEVVGRKEEIRRLAHILMQSQRNNAILVGEAGVGKTCIVEGLAQRLLSENAPPELKSKRLIELSLASLVAGTKFRGEFEERLQSVLREAEADRDIVLFIDEIHTLIGAGDAAGGMDAANVLKPALAKGELRVIGATTVGEYRRHFEKDTALARRFEEVWVEEPSPAEAQAILARVKARLERHHGVSIADGAVKAAVELSVRYLPELRLPDKAISLLDQACSRARFQTFSIAAGGSLTVGRAEIAALVEEKCRVRVAEPGDEEGRKLRDLEAELEKSVIGQVEAVRAVSEAARMARAGLKDARKPLGVFLFVGATGVGKTELAKALAECLFGSREHLIRFDMSEFSESHSVAKLIGSPPGYVGHEEEGQLVSRVRSRPHALVLFDEVEKAHPDLFDLFLQIFDEGTLTDSKGRMASFRDAVVVMTSNLGSGAGEGPAKPLGFAAAQGAPAAAAGARDRFREAITQAAKRTFRPELLNRIQKIVVFYPLELDDARRILLKGVAALQARAAARGVTLEVLPPAADLLLKRGFSAEFGARELERTVDTLLAEPLARRLLEGEVPKALRADVQDGRVVWR